MRDNERPVRHLDPPHGITERLHRARFTIARRLVQLSIIALFAGTAHLGWRLLKHPLLAGDLSTSSIASFITLSDPFALLQKLCAGLVPEMPLIVGALLVLAFYCIAGGRSFCAWVCPMNIVTDAADWLRTRLGIKTDWLRINHRVRYGIAAGCLIASAATGSAAFEWVSPQAMLWRELVWGFGLSGLCAVLGIFALDLLMVRRGWCGHLCPLGAFWSAVGKTSVTRVRFDNTRCTRCGDCIAACPEPQVINFREAAKKGFFTGAECTLCGRCIAVCPEKAVVIGIRPLKSGTCGDSDNKNDKNSPTGEKPS